MSPTTVTKLCISSLLLVGFVTACTAPPSHRVTRTEIEGVPLIRTEGGPKYEGVLFELKRDLILGVDEGEPEWQQFGRSPKALVAPDGRMVLLDDRRTEFFIVSVDGSLLHRFGREGSGPGEFQNILNVLWKIPGREFWVTDQALSRVSRFDMNGRLLGAFSYADIRMQYSIFMSLGDGRFLGQGWRDGTRPPQSIYEYTFFTGEFEQASQFMVIDQDNMFQESAAVRMQLPFTSDQFIRIGPSGRIAHVQPNIGRLSVYSSTGEPRFHTERDHPFEPVTHEDKEGYRNSYRRRGMESVAARLTFPSHKPAWFRPPVIDDEGRIWISRYSPLLGEPEEEGGQQPELGNVWEIFSAEGVWLGTHLHKERIELITYGYLYQVFLSESGSPRFERLRIIPLVPEMEALRR